MDNGLDKDLVDAFACNFFNSSALIRIDESGRLINLLASKPNIATVCTGGCVRSTLFAKALIAKGGRVLTPEGYSYGRLIDDIDTYSIYPRNKELVLPRIHPERPVETFIFHAVLGEFRGSEAEPINLILFKLAALNLRHKPSINIIEGDERFYEHNL